MKIENEIVHVEVEGAVAPMPCYLSKPSGAHSHSAVLVLEEVFGVNENIREIADRLALEGYVAIAPHIHHRDSSGLGEIEYSDEGLARGNALFAKLTQPRLTSDLNAAIDYVRNRPYVAGKDDFGCIGFGSGGHVAFLAACRLPIKATASFYGDGIAHAALADGPPTLSQAPGIKGKVLCLFGARDASIPPQDVELIRRALDEQHVDEKIVVYESAGHGFFCDRRSAYDAEASGDAWLRVKKLFADYLG